MPEITQCKQCGGDNPLDARFCIDCGAALGDVATGPTTRLTGIACRSCNANNPEHARFCVVCGRNFQSQSAPQAAAQPPRVRTYPAPARPQPHVSYSRTATPPRLTPVQPQFRQQPARAKHQQPGALIFIIGLFVLLASKALWPGILLLIGVSVLVNQIARGRADQGLRTMLWMGGMTFLISTRMIWPGIIILFVLDAMLNNRRGHWHW